MTFKFIKLEYSILYLFYFLVIILFFNFCSSFILWIILELNIITFILFLRRNINYKFIEIFNQRFFYLIVQSIGSLLFLLRNINGYIIEIFGLNVNVLITFRIILKIGIFPFHTWIFFVYKYFSKIRVFFILTFQKIILFIILFIINKLLLLPVLLINLVFGSIILFKRIELNNLLICSSIYSSVWVYMFFNSSFTFMIIFFFYYLIHIFMVISHFTNIMMETSIIILFYSLSILFLLGLPPIGLFFFKFFSIFINLSNFNITFNLVIWTFTFLATLGYFIFFFKKIFILNYSFNNVLLNKFLLHVSIGLIIIRYLIIF